MGPSKELPSDEWTAAKKTRFVEETAIGPAGQGRPLEGARADAPQRKFVRILGTRHDRYVEFEFSINDSDLAVELILPFAGFDEFCSLQNATVLPPEPAAAAQLEQLAWRSGQPGLLRRVKDAVESTPEHKGKDISRN